MARNETGSVLGLVLIYFVIFTILGMAFINIGGFEMMSTSRYYDRVRALYRAESGVHKSVWRLNKVAASSASFSDSTVSVVYKPARKQLTAVGKAGNVRKTVLVTLTNTGPLAPAYTISDWREP